MKMESTIVRGMPYATMEYSERATVSKDGLVVLPSIMAPISFGKDMIVDRTKHIKCTPLGAIANVQSEIEIHFKDSDFTWLIFFSEPVEVKCFSSESASSSAIQVQEALDSSEEKLIIRAALLDSCSTGQNPVGCRKGLGDRLEEEEQVEEYAEILRDCARFYPGKNTSVHYRVEEDSAEVEMVFDWDVQEMKMQNPDIPPKESLRQLERQNDTKHLLHSLYHTILKN